jgi:hypothetical protein
MIVRGGRVPGHQRRTSRGSSLDSCLGNFEDLGISVLDLVCWPAGALVIASTAEVSAGRWRRPGNPSGRRIGECSGSRPRSDNGLPG